MRNAYALCLLGAAIVPLCAVAAEYPAKPIRMIVAFPAGGGTDIVARIVAQKLTDSWGQQVLVDNRGGSGGVIGTELAARAAPDGYTVFMATAGNLTVNPSLYKKLSFDVMRDFEPVTLAVSLSFVLVVHPSVPVTSLQGLIALAKARPGQLSYASAGSGSATHLGMELFKSVTALKIEHIPYKGSTPAIADLLAGQVQVALGDTIVTLPHIRTGRLKPLVVTSAKRSPLLATVPTCAEPGVAGFEFTNWYGIVAPSGTPQPVLAKLSAEFVRILGMPDVVEKLAAQGVNPVGNSPQEFREIIKTEIARWAKVIKEANITTE